MLSNLLGNAVKFTPEQRTDSRCGPNPTEKFVWFWVEDTGAGIPPTHLRHVFDRYWKARPAQQEGSGLGLSIAKGIVTAHGGSIWATAWSARGAPLSSHPPHRRASPDPERPPLR